MTKELPTSLQPDLTEKLRWEIIQASNQEAEAIASKDTLKLNEAVSKLNDCYRKLYKTKPFHVEG